jgi:hypothetical protein
MKWPGVYLVYTLMPAKKRDFLRRSSLLAKTLGKWGEPALWAGLVKILGVMVNAPLQ